MAGPPSSSRVWPQAEVAADAAMTAAAMDLRMVAPIVCVIEAIHRLARCRKAKEKGAR
jgi:hypothetical protein